MFNAKTEDDLKRIESLGVKIMEQAVGAYRTATSQDEFRRLEQMRFDASNIEASRLGHARRTAIKENSIEIAKNFLKMNIPIEQISSGTGLTEKEIEELRDTDK